jgi:hypothetical protein
MAAINHPLGGARRGIPMPGPRINGWIVGAVVAVGIGATLPVLQNSMATSRGFDNQALEAQRVELQSEIRQLEAEVAQFDSIDRIERRARTIGLVPASDAIYVTVSEPGPAPARIPSEFLPRVEPERDSPDSWWRSLVRWLPLLD